MKKIGILQVGEPPKELASFGSYGQMMQDWLADFSYNFQIFDVLAAQLPERPDQCDAWLITGSRFGVYENHAWIPVLEAFIRQCYEQQVKMIGICFGHQLIAQAMGGQVVKSDKGWGIGVHQYTTQHWPDGLTEQPRMISLSVFHQDQVVKKPDQSEVLACSTFCDFAMLYYPEFALTVQGHPEFNKDYEQALVELRSGMLFSESEALAAVQSLDAPVTAPDLAMIVDVFLQT